MTPEGYTEYPVIYKKDPHNLIVKALMMKYELKNKSLAFQKALELAQPLVQNIIDEMNKNENTTRENNTDLD